jgi:hypothetical protein
MQREAAAIKLQACIHILYTVHCLSMHYALLITLAVIGMPVCTAWRLHVDLAASSIHVMQTMSYKGLQRSLSWVHGVYYNYLLLLVTCTDAAIYYY